MILSFYWAGATNIFKSGVYFILRAPSIWTDYMLSTPMPHGYDIRLTVLWTSYLPQGKMLNPSSGP